MRVLVDTQCWLWMTSAPERFSGETIRRLEARDVELLFSAACAWEIAIKHSLGKLRLPEAPAEYVTSRLRQTATTPLAVSCEHALRVAELPPHHRDPFDRLLVAQAQIEKAPILTADPVFSRYDVELMKA